MIEAGAIFHMFRSYISVGSTAPRLPPTAAAAPGPRHSHHPRLSTNNEGPAASAWTSNTSTAPPDGDWVATAGRRHRGGADRWCHRDRRRDPLAFAAR